MLRAAVTARSMRSPSTLLQRVAPAPLRQQPTRLHRVPRREYRSPPSSQENAALLRDLETALKDPDAVQRLSALIAPSTSRNLAHALTSVRVARAHPPTAVAAGAQAAVASTGSSDATAAAASATEPATVSSRDLKYVALTFGLPFVGFGFVDNAIMIIAGDYIDVTLGVSLGISSMAAAGIGNTISDIAGLGLGNVIEDLCARLGLPTPTLTQEQLMLKQTRWAKVLGSSIGVTIGCLLGMTPLLFLNTREDHAKQAANGECADDSSVQIA